MNIKETKKSLNDKQREAVESTKGPLLIIAGAGAGKTKTISWRIAELVKKGTPAEKILAITFTNKAAKEMLDRTMTILYEENLVQDFRPFIGTFHALGLKIIKENIEQSNVPKNFSIFDRNDSLRAVKEAIKTAGFDINTFQPSKILSAISRRKSEMLSHTDLNDENYFNENKILTRIWKEYEEILIREKGIDFDDIIVKSARLLQRNKNVQEKYNNLWEYIHIDEYQDTNLPQYEIARALSAKHKNICVVGDADQNIYSWRGANIKNIINFEKDYPGAKVILLEENYRSTSNILSVANTVISKNKFRKEKNLFTKRGEGEKIGMYFAGDENDEAQFVAKKTKEILKNQTSPNEIAVLMRANFQSRAIEEHFLLNNIPYQVVGVRFFERMEVKTILSFLKTAIGRGNAGDMKRIVSFPSRGLGKVALLKILSGEENTLAPSAKKSFAELKNILKKIENAVKEKTVPEIIKFVIDETGLKEALQKEEDAEERMLNLIELASFGARYKDEDKAKAIERFIEDTILASDQDEIKEKEAKVKIMTIHASKGLEFEYVFIVGLEEGLFPMEKKFEKDRMDESEREEERRLFYVALTRAKKKIFLSMASIRNIFGARELNTPSQFLSDIEDKYIETENNLSNSYTGKTIYF